MTRLSATAHRSAITQQTRRKIHCAPKGTHRLIATVTVGADDIARAKRICSAFLPSLDDGLKKGPEGLSRDLPRQNNSVYRFIGVKFAVF